jgi:cytochrome c-type biogenesis protein CcmH
MTPLPPRTGLIALMAAAVLCLGAAADPSERLADPAQEARAKALFSQVRCVVCQNESIDDSQADLAADLRRIVREEVASGRSDAQVRTFLVGRYGEFIMLKPAFSLSNAALWLTPFAIVLGGLLVFAWRSRTGSGAAAAKEDEDLTPQERLLLQKLQDPDGV